MLHDIDGAHIGSMRASLPSHLGDLGPDDRTDAARCGLGESFLPTERRADGTRGSESPEETALRTCTCNALPGRPPRPRFHSVLAGENSVTRFAMRRRNSLGRRSFRREIPFPRTPRIAPRDRARGGICPAKRANNILEKRNSSRKASATQHWPRVAWKLRNDRRNSLGRNFVRVN